MRWQILISALTLLLTGDLGEVLACSCDQLGPPCQNYFQSDVVFVGTVRSVTPMPGAQLDARVRVEFQDAVPSRGVDGTSMTVFTSDNSASCGYAFTLGERYVVYASRSNDGARIHTSICSRTRPLSEADEDVRFFDTLATPAAGARVFGTITHWEQDVTRTRARDYGPVGNVDVTLRGADRSFQARTDQNGRYELTGIPSGRYDLTAAPPPPYSTAFLKRQFELRDPRACFRADFGLRYDSRVSGTIVDADGKPATGAIVEILPVEQIGNPVYVPPETMIADEAGLFEMAEVSPGRYVLGVNLKRGGGSGNRHADDLPRGIAGSPEGDRLRGRWRRARSARTHRCAGTTSRLSRHRHGEICRRTAGSRRNSRVVRRQCAVEASCGRGRHRYQRRVFIPRARGARLHRQRTLRGAGNARPYASSWIGGLRRFRRGRNNRVGFADGALRRKLRSS